MAKNAVVIAGFNLTLEGSGYRVTFWYQLDQGRQHTEHYHGLSWTEAVDVIIAEADAHRPGWELGEGWRQPSLDEELDRPWG